MYGGNTAYPTRIEVSGQALVCMFRVPSPAALGRGGGGDTHPPLLLTVAPPRSALPRTPSLRDRYAFPRDAAKIKPRNNVGSEPDAVFRPRMRCFRGRTPTPPIPSRHPPPFLAEVARPVLRPPARSLRTPGG